MRNVARVVGQLLVLLALSIASVARAQGSDPAAAADALFREGRAAMKAGDFKAACPKFVESHRLDPAPGTAVNIGDCLEKLGKLADALQAYRDALDLMRPGDDRTAPVTAQFAILARRVPRLTIVLASDAPAGTRVLSNGVEVAAASVGAELPVNAGTRTIEVSAPGHESRAFTVELTEGTQRSIEVAPGPAHVTHQSTDATDTTRTGRDKTLGYVLAGIGVAGLAVGTITGIVVLNKKAAADQGCNDDTRTCTVEGKQADEAGRQLAPISTIGFLVGIAGLGTGAYLIFSDNTDGRSTAAAARVGLFGKW